MIAALMVGIFCGSEVKRGGRRRRKSGLVVTWPKRKLEKKEKEKPCTQRAIHNSSDEADAQRGEEKAEGGDLVTLAPEIFDQEENVKMDLNRKWTALRTEVQEEDGAGNAV